MSNEIQVSLSIKYAKTASKIALALSAAFFADQVGDKYEQGVQSIGTVEEQIQKGDVGTIGWLYIRNLDTTNFVQVGAAAGQYAGKIAAGKAALLPWNGAAIYAKADTAAVEMEYLVIEA